MASKNLITYLAMLSLVAFVAVSLFGLGHTAGMKANEDGNMEGCIFTGKTMLCQMGIGEHISLWQGMFAATPQKISVLLTLIVLLVAAVFVIINHWLRTASIKQELVRRFYLFRNTEINLFDPLRRAFSRGIIHPKIYESAVL